MDYFQKHNISYINISMANSIVCMLSFKFWTPAGLSNVNVFDLIIHAPKIEFVSITEVEVEIFISKCPSKEMCKKCVIIYTMFEQI